VSIIGTVALLPNPESLAIAAREVSEAIANGYQL
jgi:hypothetical protein